MGPTTQAPPDVTPHECRLRDLTYSGVIYVDVQYRRGSEIVTKRGQPIGRLPIMLKSNLCHLHGKDTKEMAQVLECPLDPGGYFVVKGTEKVILVHEQISKNRPIVEVDLKRDLYQASVACTTHERKVKTYIISQKGKMYLHQNGLAEDVPIVLVFKAMGCQSDREIFELVAGDDQVYGDTFAINLEECAKLEVFTQQQALEWLGTRVRIPKRGNIQRGKPQEEALEFLMDFVLAHVPVPKGDFRGKIVYTAVMARRVLMAMKDPKLVDDRDYVGNKRLELYSQRKAR
jgi:DNA-directed RNA polymerase III subunit RPC2